MQGLALRVRNVTYIIPQAECSHYCEYDKTKRLIYSIDVQYSACVPRGQSNIRYQEYARYQIL